MSKKVDERVVEMRFDNQQFESNVKTSLSTIEKLKKALKFDGVGKGLENVSNSAKKVDFSAMSNGIETVNAKFSSLQVVAMTALSNITTAAMNAGKNLISSLTLDPIISGFQEYETQINSVQTILANTQSKGSTLDDVNKALDELNKYADQTIYNFTEMTRNIGTFTAAGVDLDKAVTSIKGIANLAAVSGSNSVQASTAMYQLSQALAAGRVSLMDWNSVVNAGMGGELFQNALKRTAEHMGTNVDALIKKYGSFRESLTEGQWLTADVLTETLTQLSGAYSEADLIAQGYTEEQAKQITELANTAVDAATKVKTATQLFDTLGEALQSGWTQSWEIIIGDFEEAKALFTEISDGLGSVINESAESRNNMLQGWADLGGRTALIDGFRFAFEGLGSVLTIVGKAFREVFPATTSQQLFDMTKGFRDLMESLKPSEKTLSQIGRVAKGVFSIFDLGKQAIMAILSPIGRLMGSEGFGGLGSTLLEVAASIGDFFTSLDKGAKAGNVFGGISDSLSTVADGISGALKKITDGVGGFSGLMSSIGNGIAKFATAIKDTLGDAITWISEHVSLGDIFNGIGVAGLVGFVRSFSGVADKIKEVIDKIFGGDEGGSTLQDLADGLGDALESLHGSLEAFTTGLKSASLVAIAVAIGILTASLRSLAELDPSDIAKSIGAMGGMFVMLNLSFRSIVKSLSTFDSKGLVKASIALIAMSEALKILSEAMENVSKLDLKEIGKSLTALGGGLAELIIGLRFLDGKSVSLKTSIAMLALAKACQMLSEALVGFSDMSWDEIGRGLAAMGGALGELVVALSILSKAGGFGSVLGSVGILIAVQALDDISESLKKFSELSWERIKKGLSAMGGALGELAVALAILSKVGGFGSVLGSVGILIAVQSLDEISENLKKLGDMSWDEIGRGLSAMGGALAEVAVASGALGKFAGLSGIIGSGSILITVQGLGDLANAFSDFGDMSWEEIGRGLAGMGGALAEVAVISGALGKLAGISGIIGSGAILIVIQGLGDLANAFKEFGGMSWEEIGRGLVGMGGALLEVAAMAGVLGTVAGLAGIIGGASILLVIQGLGDLADAFKKFAEMDWESIKRGLAAMGGALGETALGGLLNTFSGIGASAISQMAEPLGTLADSVKKWSGVTVPEGLGEQLGTLADGIGKFTFSGMGAGSLSAAAEPLGILADSVKKWTGVVVPEGLSEQCGQLADAIGKFTFSGIGAGGLSAAAEPLGTLAESVKKWTGVTIPEGIGEKLSDLASGVTSFSLAFAGGWSISQVVEPLGNLAGAVKKWADVVIPTNIKTGLTNLADGVGAFSLSFVGGWSISQIVDPLKDLAGAVKTWNGIVIPTNVKTGLTGLADGLKAFANTRTGDLSNVKKAIEDIGKAAQSIAGINFVSIASGLKSFADSISNINVSTSNFSNLGNKIVDGLVTALTSGQGRVSAAATSLANTAVNSFSTAVSSASARSRSAGLALVNGLSSGMRAGLGGLRSATTTLINSALTVIRSHNSSFRSAGSVLTGNLSNGISARRSSVSSAIRSCLSAASSSIRSYYGSFYSAGSYLAQGLANGIASRSASAAAQAARMASNAAAAARKAAQVHSPSRVFYKIGAYMGEGMTNALEDYQPISRMAGEKVADSAISGLKLVASRVSAILDSDVEMTPTITPVIDLSSVQSGVRSIDSMVSGVSSINLLSNVGSISRSMNSRNQNGSIDDVVSAVNKLRDKLDNLSQPSYSIGGITYDDGSAISGAIESLIRATRIERRS